MEDTNARKAKRYESLILRIDFLKENFEYQEAFAKIKSCFQDDANHPEFKAFVEKLLPFFSKIGFNPPKISSYLHALYNQRTEDRQRAEGFLEFFEPEKGNKELYESLLPWIYLPTGVVQILPENECEDYHLPEAPFKRVSIGSERLLPYQRLLLIDLTVKKSELIKEFNNFINNAEIHRREAPRGNIDHPEVDKRHVETYSSWEIDKTRERKEARQQLEIWKMRKQYKSFKEIAQETNLTVRTAEKAFYKAYERTQNKRYTLDDGAFKRTQALKKSDLKKKCDTCPDRGTCKIPCPEILKYINQDTRSYTREKLASDLPFPAL